MEIEEENDSEWSAEELCAVCGRDTCEDCVETWEMEQNKQVRRSGSSARTHKHKPNRRSRQSDWRRKHGGWGDP